MDLTAPTHLAVCDEEAMSSASVGLSDLSDEILLFILHHVPVCDLLLNVANVCHRLHTLCQDKTLLTKVNLSEEYMTNEFSVGLVLKQLASHVQSLSLNGCYWLSPSHMEPLVRCREVTQLDITGCRFTSLRLSRLLSSLSSLTSLAFTVRTGFNPDDLSSEALGSLSRLSELRQTLLMPSYGVVPCCAQLRKLMLQFDIPDVNIEGLGVCCQLVIGQSSVPHYQHLEEFTARLAPGEVNQTLLPLYLAVFNIHVPKGLRVFLVSIPAPNPGHWPAAPALAQILGQRGDLVALQLPQSWLDPPSLMRALEGNSPKHLSFSRCPTLWPQMFQSMVDGGVRDPTCLISLNLSGINHIPYSECRNVDDLLVAGTMSQLCACCSNIQHLNLMHRHYHYEASSVLDGKTHLCASLAQLQHLRSLTLPACAVSDGANTNRMGTNGTLSLPLFQGLIKAPRVGLQNYKPNSETVQSENGTTGLALLTDGCPNLETFELIGSGFVSALPRLEPCTRASVEPRWMCAWARGVGDSQLAALAALPQLRRLTLAGLPGVLKGTGLVQLTRQCREIRVLSLANLGSVKTMNYMPSLLDSLKECSHLQELRLEQPYLNANASFFEALSCCSRLQRLCLISRCGTFDSSATERFMEQCCHVVVCHMFMGGTLVSCRTLQKALLDRFSKQRPALSVVIYPLQHEELPSVIRDIPPTLLDCITLFQSHVAQPLHLSLL